MSCCAVKWCGNNSKTCSVTTNKITFHRFPKDGDMKNKWINVTKRENWFPSKYSVMCSKHFTEDCFLKINNKRRLIRSAVPTLFLPITVASGASEASSCGSTPSKKKRKLYSGLDDDDNGSDSEDLEDSEDEYAAWAKEWALELRQMDPEQQIFAKRAITYVLMEGRLGLLNKNSVLVNNKAPEEQPTQKDLNDAPLEEFLMINNKNPKASSVAIVSEEIAAPSDSKSSLVDTETSSVTVSHKTAASSSRVKSKTTGKARASRSVNFSRKTTASDSGSSFDDTESSFIVTSHKTPTTVSSSSSSSLVKTEPSEGPGSSSTDGSSSLITKLEPLESTEATSYEIQDPLFLTVERCSNTGPPLLSASHENVTAVRSPVKSELNSPPSSPEFTVVVKSE